MESVDYVIVARDSVTTTGASVRCIRENLGGISGGLAGLQVDQRVDALKVGGHLSGRLVDHEHEVVDHLGRPRHHPRVDADLAARHDFVDEPGVVLQIHRARAARLAELAGQAQMVVQRVARVVEQRHVPAHIHVIVQIQIRLGVALVVVIQAWPHLTSAKIRSCFQESIAASSMQSELGGGRCKCPIPQEER